MLKVTTILCIGSLFVVSSSAPLGAQDAPSEETIQFFQLNCASCHTIGGGPLTGPDLKGVLERKDRDWLSRFIMDPKALFDSGDPYALGILAEARGVPMPTLPGLGAVRAGKLVDLIAAESALPKSRFAGIQLSDRPLTSADVARGESLFLGGASFQNQGAACISCHTLGGIGGLGGGHLGPDLTSAFARLEGRRGLGAWLASPPSLVMQPLYADRPLESEEILALVAFMKANATTQSPSQGSQGLLFVLAGIGIAAVCMVGFDVLWRRRFRAVRRPLVARS